MENPDTHGSNKPQFRAWLRALNLAFTFLSRLPMPAIEHVSSQDTNRATLLFPLVGLFIGLGLASIALLAAPLDKAAILAAAALIFWAFVTGGLHIDGLADSADAWLGGLGDTQRSLEIMKDPRCGSGGLMAVTCLLIGKFAALYTLIQYATAQYADLGHIDSQFTLYGLFFAVAALPVLGRAASLAIFSSCPYVSAEGSAQQFIQGIPSPVLRRTIAAYIALGTVMILSLGVVTVIACLGSMALAWVLLRRLMMQRLSGCTGDTAGATVELVELAGALALALSLGHL